MVGDGLRGGFPSQSQFEEVRAYDTDVEGEEAMREMDAIAPGLGLHHRVGVHVT